MKNILLKNATWPQWIAAIEGNERLIEEILISFYQGLLTAGLFLNFQEYHF